MDGLTIAGLMIVGGLVGAAIAGLWSFSIEKRREHESLKVLGARYRKRH